MPVAQFSSLIRHRSIDAASASSSLGDPSRRRATHRFVWLALLDPGNKTHYRERFNHLIDSLFSFHDKLGYGLGFKSELDINTLFTTDKTVYKQTEQWICLVEWWRVRKNRDVDNLSTSVGVRKADVGFVAWHKRPWTAAEEETRKAAIKAKREKRASAQVAPIAPAADQVVDGSATLAETPTGPSFARLSDNPTLVSRLIAVSSATSGSHDPRREKECMTKVASLVGEMRSPKSRGLLRARRQGHAQCMWYALCGHVVCGTWIGVTLVNAEFTRYFLIDGDERMLIADDARGTPGGNMVDIGDYLEGLQPGSVLGRTVDGTGPQDVDVEVDEEGAGRLFSTLHLALALLSEMPITDLARIRPPEPTPTLARLQTSVRTQMKSAEQLEVAATYARPPPKAKAADAPAGTANSEEEGDDDRDDAAGGRGGNRRGGGGSGPKGGGSRGGGSGGQGNRRSERRKRGRESSGGGGGDGAGGRGEGEGARDDAAGTAEAAGENTAGGAQSAGTHQTPYDAIAPDDSASRRGSVSSSGLNGASAEWSEGEGEGEGDSVPETTEPDYEALLCALNLRIVMVPPGTMSQLINEQREALGQAVSAGAPTAHAELADTAAPSPSTSPIVTPPDSLNAVPRRAATSDKRPTASFAEEPVLTVDP